MWLRGHCCTLFGLQRSLHQCWCVACACAAWFVDDVLCSCRLTACLLRALLRRHCRPDQLCCAPAAHQLPEQPGELLPAAAALAGEALHCSCLDRQLMQRAGAIIKTKLPGRGRIDRVQARQCGGILSESNVSLAVHLFCLVPLECVDQCAEVLAVDAANRKALYRRGELLGCCCCSCDLLRHAVCPAVVGWDAHALLAFSTPPC